MSVLTKVLAEEVRKIEETASVDLSLGNYRLTHHLMPPVGWLNDPNGLCFYKGRYHVFFQYAPFEANGGLKFWGHYSSKDLISWKYESVSLYPDSPYDCHGVYSGSALVEDDKMHLFYTGNVKIDGDYDYINNGRKTSTLHVESEDGENFGIKDEVIPFFRYPDSYTCHIRDPKVWKDGAVYRMVLGGRLKENKGAVLFYQSEDMKSWNFDKEMTTEKPFGYMWECPDFFELDGQQVLSVSPQGLERHETFFQNMYQSGYFPVNDGVKAEDFREWDMGFDFYAPQTFLDEQGRRILIGWMGMPDCEDEYVNPTVAQGWQHCLTVPRSLSFRDGKIYQWPVDEMEQLRGEAQDFRGKEAGEMAAPETFDMEAVFEGTASDQEVRVSLDEDLVVEYKSGLVSLILSEDAGAGRKSRHARVDELREIRILKDTSAVEIYLNGGETVFSTRYYPKSQNQTLKIQAENFSGKLWNLGKMSFTK